MSEPRKARALPLVATWLCLALILVSAGCTAKQYQRQADRETYKIIQQVENGIFGHTNQFSIDTDWSQRDPNSILAPEIVAARSETNRLTLTLEEALDLAARQSRRYQTEKERLYLTALSLTGERYKFSPQFFATANADYERSSNGDETGSVGSSAGASLTHLFRTGGQLTASVANDILNYYIGDPRTDTVRTLVSLNLAQPLLRGFGRNNAAIESLTQAERNVLYAVRSYSYFQKEYAIGIVNQYFNLLAQKNVIRNTYSNYMSQAESTRRLVARSKDRESLEAVDRARSSELGAKNDYVNRVADYFNSLDGFKLELGIPLGVRLFLDDSELNQLEAIGLIDVNLDSEAAYRLAVERNYDLLNSIDRFEDTKRKLSIAADQLKPGLDLTGNASLESEPPTDYTQFDIDKVRYGVGLQLDLPIDRVRERNNYRAALVNFEADIRGLALDLDDLKDQIESDLRTLRQRRQNYIIQQNSVTIANRRVQLSLLRLQGGQGEVIDLVDAQNDQIAAQNSLVSALVSYQATRLQLMLTLGIIETESDQFWFRSQLENTPQILAAGAGSQSSESEAVSTPDEVFSN